MTATLNAARPPREAVGTRATRVGAGLGIAGIVLMATGFAIAMPGDALLTTSRSDVVAFYIEADLARTLAGGVTEVFGIVLFLPFAAMLTARVAAAGVARELLAPTARMAATVYVAISLAPGMSAGATALWLAHHGTTDPGVLTALNGLRSLSYFAALVAFALFLVTVGAAGMVTGRLPRWAGWSAVVVGAGLAANVPVAAYEIADLFALAGVLWVVAVGAALLRRPEPSA
jgi:hypothetical protein